MKRYWIIAQSKNDPYHRHNGAVVLAPEEGDMPRCYIMDLSIPNTSLLVPRHKLARWHSTEESHQHCFCKRKDKRNENI